MSWRVFLITCLSLLIFKSVYSQDVNSLLKKIEVRQEQQIQEKFYLHLNKNAYTAGESIWFKVYNTIGIHNFNANWSNIAYIELINAQKHRVDSMVIPLIMGLGMGDFKLSDTITEGSYRIRAYTNYMRNFSEDYFYDRTIHIANGRSDKTLSTIELISSEKELAYTINFKSLLGTSLQKKNGKYDVVVDGKVVKSRNIRTDEHGNVSVSIEPKYEGADLILKLNVEDNQVVKKHLKLRGPKKQHSVQVFPDGGHLLANKLNYIGVKALQSNGLGIPSKVVFMQSGDTTAVLETNVLGMGGAYVYIDGSKELQIKAEFEDQSKVEVPAPVIEKSGYAIAINNQQDNKIFAQITVTDDLIKQQELYFIAHHMGEPFYVGKQKVAKDQLLFSVDTKKLPMGIVTFTVLDDHFRPILERPVFAYQPNSILQGKVNLNKDIFKSREKVAVDIEVGENTDSIRMGSFSASVVDLQQIKEEDRLASNIWSTLWMQSDLRGYIETPGFYFTPQEIKRQDIDYLLLTQGWRKLDWTNLDQQTPLSFDVEKGQKIAGYTKKIGRQKAEPNAKIQLVPTHNYMDFIDTVANEDGYFVFDNILFPDSVKFLISAKDAVKGKNNIDIIMEQQNWASISTNKNAPDERSTINTLYKDQIDRNNRYFTDLENKGLMDKAIAIEEVVVRGNVRKKAAENSSNLNGPGNADAVITAEELETCTNLEQCLQGRLVGVYWQGGVPMNTRSQAPMQVVLDGMYIEADMISTINTFDIESIEVLRNMNYTSIYGSYGGNGLIIITSKTGKVSRGYTPKGILTYQPKGLHMNRTFYKPTYEVDSQQALQNDWRSTIHWEANLITDDKGKGKFDFYTGDAKGEYLMIIEGVSVDGRLLRKEVEIKVD